MNNFKLNEIESVIKSTPDDAFTKELSSVIFSLGRDAENEEEYDYALSMLFLIFNRDNESVKAEVIQAFSLISILKKEIKKLDVKIIEPLVHIAWSNAKSDKNKAKIKYSVEDINLNLNSNINLI